MSVYKAFGYAVLFVTAVWGICGLMLALAAIHPLLLIAFFWLITVLFITALVHTFSN